MNFNKVIAIPSDRRLAMKREHAELKTFRGQVKQTGRFFMQSLPATVMELYKKVKTDISEVKDDGSVVAFLSRDQVRDFTFPPGHPILDQVYVEHPVLAGTYYPLAPFHRIVFEHKFSEALSLLIHLGAKELRVVFQQGWGRDFAANLNIPLPSGGAMEVSMNGKSATMSMLLFEASLNPTAPAHLPAQLFWFPHEPTWRALAEARLKSNLQRISLAVNYDDDFGVSASLKGHAQAIGLAIGGNFHEHQATSWKIEGSFAQRCT
ncbi:hypothetical protein [Roseateles sp.]|uniref:hypothetical protein n=1 Tax=Roseateles sp. TaxID=1971397 RepID=UPI002DFD3393|nr:hypothetical protein [Roseateles sp.]